jgi:hypothetical protein
VGEAEYIKGIVRNREYIIQILTPGKKSEQEISTAYFLK